MVAASLKSEATAAAEFKGKDIMHDPMAMRPFMGYNFGQYLQHWLDMEQPGRIMPKIFHVNWFRLDEQTGKFLWPGFGENIRVIDWMCRRVAGEDNFVDSPVGRLPKEGTINLEGMEKVEWEKLFGLPKGYWTEDVKETRKFFEEQVGCDLPAEIAKQLDEQEKRIGAMK
jgi:phosphoenolpyruvate carboxykinase (GTP)